jgi:hypothetical protein
MNLSNVFGVNVHGMFMDWFNGEFTEMFEGRFPGKGMTLVILDTDDIIELERHWRDPMGRAMIVAHIGDKETAVTNNGTMQNVEGKLRFVLRTGRNSVDAETQQDLVSPGDFPWEGAGHYRNNIGGVSGLAKEEDWEMLCICVDKLIDLLKQVNTAAMAMSDKLRRKTDCPAGAKYLNGINVSGEFPDMYAA